MKISDIDFFKTLLNKEITCIKEYTYVKNSLKIHVNKPKDKLKIGAMCFTYHPLDKSSNQPVSYIKQICVSKTEEFQQLFDLLKHGCIFREVRFCTALVSDVFKNYKIIPGIRSKRHFTYYFK